MTDKVQKIREEVERLQIELIQEKEKGYGSDADDACILELQNVLTYIDSLQEEPVSEDTMTIRKEWFEHCKKSWYNEGYIDGKHNRDSQFGEPVSDECIYNRTLEERQRSCKFCSAACQVRIKEPVSENLEKAEKEWLTPQLDKSYADYGETKMMELTRFDGYAMLDAIEFGAKWQKERDNIPVSDDLEKIVEEIAEPTILNAYGTKELARRLHNTICSKSVSEDLNEAAIAYNKKVNFICVGEIPNEHFIAGAQWQKEQLQKEQQ